MAPRCQNRRAAAKRQRLDRSEWAAQRQQQDALANGHENLRRLIERQQVPAQQYLSARIAEADREASLRETRIKAEADLRVASVKDKAMQLTAWARHARRREDEMKAMLADRDETIRRLEESLSEYVVSVNPQF
jgi:hypothetical protein